MFPLDKNSQLFEAVTEGNLESTQRLILDGVPIDFLDHASRLTPLGVASHYGHTEIVHLLLEAGADPNAHPDAEGQYNQQPCANHPLFEALMGGHVETVRALLGARSNYDISDRSGETPLHYAAQFGPAEIVQSLLDAGAKPSPQNSMMGTPLHHAAKYGDLQMIEALLKAGANPNIADELSQTPLQLAVERCGSAKKVKALLDAGATATDASMLLHAARYEDTETVELLLGAGVDPNARDDRGDTSLHLAAERGWAEICLRLATRGASTDARNNDGKTAIDMARENGHMETAGTIESYVLALKEKALVSQVCDGVAKMDSVAVGNELRSMGEPVSEAPRAGRTTARRSMRL